jgi:hypothetical protein
MALMGFDEPANGHAFTRLQLLRRTFIRQRRQNVVGQVIQKMWHRAEALFTRGTTWNDHTVSALRD